MGRYCTDISKKVWHLYGRHSVFEIRLSMLTLFIGVGIKYPNILTLDVLELEGLKQMIRCACVVYRFTYAHFRCLTRWVFNSGMHWHFMSVETPFISKFWATLIAWVFDTLMYWNFMCLEVILLSKFWVALITLIFDTIMHRHFILHDNFKLYTLAQTVSLGSCVQ